MGYEIDFIPVGDGERSGDAIALRWGNLYGSRSEQTVMTIDGGTKDSGAELVRHVRENYKTEKVDLALLTHPDGDHAYGMGVILEELQVAQVAMHLPWEHSGDILAAVDDDRSTVSSLSERSKRRLVAAHDAFKLAKSKPVEPFAGDYLNANGGSLKILGPTKDFYQSCLQSFRHMPGGGASTLFSSAAGAFVKIAEAITKWIPENWQTETLKEPSDDATSRENNSSVIFLLEVEGRKLLFTGDAGVPALTVALTYAKASGTSLEGINFLQVPHHGSRKNLGPAVLNKLFGPPRLADVRSWCACVSAAKNGEPKHPHKKVMNALRRRGANVQVTAGQHLLYTFNAPQRPNWETAPAAPFYEQVEDDD